MGAQPDVVDRGSPCLQPTGFTIEGTKGDGEHCALGYRLSS
jgi:hypothetical protein